MSNDGQGWNNGENLDTWDNLWLPAVKEEDPQKKLMLYKQALEEAEKEDFRIGKAGCLAAIRMIEETESIQKLVFRGSGTLNLVHDNNTIWWSVGHASCTSLHDFRDTVGHPEWHLIWQPIFPYSYWEPYFRLPIPPVLGKSWENSSRNQKIHVASILESVTETMEVPAGRFENCLKIKNSIVQEEGSVAQQVSGTSLLWFCSDAGLIKQQYCHADGDETLIELLSYSVNENPDSPLPLNVGNTWTYIGTKESNPVLATHTFWVNSPSYIDKGSGRSNWYIPYYSYSVLE